MMGLLDILKSDDPAVKQGIMQFGLSLLGSKGGLANALGQAGMQGLQGSQQYKQQQFQRQLQQSQLEQMQRQKMMQGREDDLAALPGKFIVPPSVPGMDATGGMETALEAPNNQASPQGRQDFGGLAQALMAAPGGFAQGLGLRQALRKDDTPIKASAGDVFFDRTGKQLFAAPEKVDALDPFVRLLTQSGIDPKSPEGRKLLSDRARKESTHQQPTTIVNHGSPIPVDLGGGRTGYAQPTNRGGAVSPMTTPQGTPLLKPSDAKAKDITESQAKSTLYLGMMKSSTSELEKMGALDVDFAGQAEVAAAGSWMSPIVSAKAQRTQQAKYQWAEAMLRALTGAAAPDAEVKRNVETFFPKVGDKPEQVAQKKRQRAEMEKAIAISAGPGAGRLDVGGGLPDMSAIEAELARREGR